MFLRFQQLADGIVHHKGRVGQRRPLAAAQGGDEHIVFVELDLLGIAENVGRAQLPGGVISDVHGGADRQHRVSIALTGIDRRRQFGVAEAVQHTVVADAVPGAKVLVSLVIEHAPAEAPGVLPAGIGCVLYPDVPQGVLLPVRAIVKGLGGVHVAVALRDEQRLAHIRGHVLFRLSTGRYAVVRKIVVGIDILQQMAFFQIAHAGGSTAGVQLMGDFVGAGIEGIVVHALVDAHTPQDDAGVIAVLQEHLLQHLAGGVLPVVVPDVLPARQFSEHQQTPPVALVQKILALGVVAGAHGGAMQLLLQNAGILPLQAFRCGVTDVRVALVSVQTPQKGLFAVEVETIRPELCGAEAKRHLFAVDGLPRCVQKLCHGMMQHRVLCIPRLCFRHRKLHLPGFCRRCSLLCQQSALSGLQPDADRRGCGRKLCCPLHHSLLQGGRVDEQISQTAFCRSFQPDLPVQPAVGQVINDKTKGWNRWVFTGVQLHGQQVFTLPVHKVGDLHRKAGIATPVLPGNPAVDPHHRLMGSAVKADKQSGRSLHRRHSEPLPVAADHLVISGGGIVQRHLPAGMGQADGLLFWHRQPLAKGLCPVSCELPVLTKTVFHRGSTPSSKIEIISSSTATYCTPLSARLRSARKLSMDAVIICRSTGRDTGRMTLSATACSSSAMVGSHPFSN